MQELVVFLLLHFHQQILLLILLHLLLILTELDLVVDILEVLQHQITLETLVGEEFNLPEELKRTHIISMEIMELVEFQLLVVLRELFHLNFKTILLLKLNT